MENVYLVPFHAAEQAGAGSFMSAYMDLNDVPASGNKWLLTDVLRKDWGFKGFVVSDAFAVGSLVTHGFARDGEDAAYKAATAGVNMDMASQTYTHNLAKVVAASKVNDAQLDALVLPILETKYELGLFEHPYVDETKVECDVDAAGGTGAGAEGCCAVDGAAEEREQNAAAGEEREEDCGDWSRWPTRRGTLKADGRWRDCLAAAGRATR